MALAKVQTDHNVMDPGYYVIITKAKTNMNGMGMVDTRLCTRRKQGHDTH